MDGKPKSGANAPRQFSAHPLSGLAPGADPDPDGDRGVEASVRSSTHPGIVRGLAAVSACSAEHGLVPGHLGKLAALSQRQRVAFGFRPINPLATQLIDAGYPTKGLEIKGKSANAGPMAGFIPVAQKFSKLAGSPEEIARSDQQIRACIEKGDAVSLPLLLTMDRLDALREKGIVDITGAFGDERITMTSEMNGEAHVFEGRLRLDKDPASYALLHDGESVQVLGKPATDTAQARPMTADYDLLLIAVPFGELGSEDNYLSSPACKPHGSPLRKTKVNPLISRIFKKSPDPLHDTGSVRAKSAFGFNAADLATSAMNASGANASDGEGSVGEASPAAASNQADRRESDMSDQTPSPRFDHGFTSPRVNKLIDAMNLTLGCTDDNRIVQHGPDTHNPKTVLADNFPSVIFAPCLDATSADVLTADVLMVKDTEATVIVYKELKERGLQFFGNDDWNFAMPRKGYRRSSYDNAAVALEANLAQSLSPATRRKPR